MLSLAARDASLDAAGAVAAAAAAAPPPGARWLALLPAAGAPAAPGPGSGLLCRALPPGSPSLAAVRALLAAAGGTSRPAAQVAAAAAVAAEAAARHPELLEALCFPCGMEEPAVHAGAAQPGAAGGAAKPEAGAAAGGRRAGGKGPRSALDGLMGALRGAAGLKRERPLVSDTGCHATPLRPGCRAAVVHLTRIMQ